MSIEKKSLISNRTAVKKANLTKASDTKVSSVSSTKLGPVKISGVKVAASLTRSHVIVR